jgi:hypothetical protein
MYWMNRGAVVRRCCHSTFDDDEIKVSYVRGGSRGRPAPVSLPCPSDFLLPVGPGVSLSSDPYVVHNALTPNRA